MRSSDINIDFTNGDEDFYSRPRQPVRVDKSKQVLDLVRYIMNQCQLDTSSVDWAIVEKELRKIL